MKRKIAVCGNGWNNEYLEIVMSGMKRCAAENDVDIFWLCNYSDNNVEEFKKSGDTNIYRLLEHGDFDGVILLANTFHLQQEFDYLCDVINQKKLPAVSLEYQLPGIDSWCSDNYSGMRELMLHLVEEHGVKKVVYVSGPKGNEESDTRRKALEDVLKEKGLSLTTDDIIYGNWNYYEVGNKLPEWINAHAELPDAFVCANDVMAMAACAALESLKVDVPGDVKVTGFDNLMTARTFYPSIASVNRNWDDAAFRGMQYLLDKMAGERDGENGYIHSVAVPAESCGCHSVEADQFHKDVRKKGLYANYVNVSFWEGHLCDIGDCLTMVVSDEEFHEKFSGFLQITHGFEGDEIYFCLVDNFFTSFKDGTELKKTGYTSKMDLICGMKEGQLLKREVFDTGQLIPGYDESDGGGRIYVFLPLYSEEGCYGYVALGSDRPMLYDYSACNWNRIIIQNFSRVRQNIMMADLNQRLEKASVTDALTGVYNRSGCEKIAYPYLEKCHEQGKNAVLMFADINKMKHINDKYGHVQGDMAIRTVAGAIKAVLSDEWIVVRYGGDEFIMVGECEHDNEPDCLAADISNQLDKMAAKMHLPYHLKAGVGYVLVDASENLDLSECLKKADDAMYLMKKQQQEEM